MGLLSIPRVDAVGRWPVSAPLVFGSPEANEIARLNRALSSAVPCPLCEGDAQLSTARHDGKKVFRFVCRKCRVQAAQATYGSYYESKWQPTPILAADAWNKAVAGTGWWALTNL